MISSWEFFAFINLPLYTLIFEKTSRSEAGPDMTPEPNIMNTRFFLWRSRVSFLTAKQS